MNDTQRTRYRLNNALVRAQKVRCQTRLTGLAAIITSLLFLTGCSGPFSTLDPAGPSATYASWMWWGMAIPFTVILIAVVGLWLYAMFRPARTWNDEEARRVQHRWILGGGLALPLVSITLILIFGIPLGNRMLPLEDDSEAVQIHVTGHQWWWQVRYPDTNIELRDQLYIPAGVPIHVHLTSADVIHSFWVPRLGGKLDMIPGHTNVLLLQADEPGEYRGQCAEFCGRDHAHMQFVVTALPPEAYDAWLEEAQADE